MPTLLVVLDIFEMFSFLGCLFQTNPSSRATTTTNGTTSSCTTSATCPKRFSVETTAGRICCISGWCCTIGSMSYSLKTWQFIEIYFIKHDWRYLVVDGTIFFSTVDVHIRTCPVPGFTPSIFVIRVFSAVVYFLDFLVCVGGSSSTPKWYSIINVEWT